MREHVISRCHVASMSQNPMVPENLVANPRVHELLNEFFLEPNIIVRS